MVVRLVLGDECCLAPKRLRFVPAPVRKTLISINIHKGLTGVKRF
jgi:hypothetical protein